MTSAVRVSSVAARPAVRATARRSARVVAVMALVVVLQAPDGLGAAPGEGMSAEDEREEVQDRQEDVELEIGDLEDELGEAAETLSALADDVETREDGLEDAERAVEDAEEDLEAAEEAIEAAEERIEVLEAATDTLMVGAYVSPPNETMVSAFSAETMSDAMVKSVLLDLSADSNADVFDELGAAYEDLEIERDNQATVAADAEAARQEEADALGELQSAVDVHEGFAADAESALESKLAESAMLEERDDELAEQIAAEEAAELARELEAARAAERARAEEAAEAGAETSRSEDGGGDQPAPPGTSPPATSPPAASVSPGPGGLATVSCPNGGAITVAASLGSSLSNLLEAAARDGHGLCGWGYRDSERQIALRRQNCGGSNYAVYQMPASQCSPPTARPGQSMHEQGLAVDFTCDGGSIGTRSNRCFRWLAANASGYGLYNLPSEPWHWSTTGG